MKTWSHFVLLEKSQPTQSQTGPRHFDLRKYHVDDFDELKCAQVVWGDQPSWSRHFYAVAFAWNLNERGRERLRLRLNLLDSKQDELAAVWNSGFEPSYETVCEFEDSVDTTLVDTTDFSTKETKIKSKGSKEASATSLPTESPVENNNANTSSTTPSTNNAPAAHQPLMMIYTLDAASDTIVGKATFTIADAPEPEAKAEPKPGSAAAPEPEPKLETVSNADASGDVRWIVQEPAPMSVQIGSIPSATGKVSKNVRIDPTPAMIWYSLDFKDCKTATREEDTKEEDQSVRGFWIWNWNFDPFWCFRRCFRKCFGKCCRGSKCCRASKSRAHETIHCYDGHCSSKPKQD